MAVGTDSNSCRGQFRGPFSTGKVRSCLSPFQLVRGLGRGGREKVRPQPSPPGTCSACCESWATQEEGWLGSLSWSKRCLDKTVAGSRLFPLHCAMSSGPVQIKLGPHKSCASPLNPTSPRRPWSKFLLVRSTGVGFCCPQQKSLMETTVGLPEIHHKVHVFPLKPQQDGLDLRTC